MNEKQKKRLAAIQRQQALVDAAKNGKREMTPEEEAEYQTLQREVERLNTEIAAEEEAQRSLGGGTPPAPTTPPGYPSRSHRRTGRRPAADRGGAYPHPQHYRHVPGLRP